MWLIIPSIHPNNAAVSFPRSDRARETRVPALFEPKTWAVSYNAMHSRNETTRVATTPALTAKQNWVGPTPTRHNKVRRWETATEPTRDVKFRLHATGKKKTPNPPKNSDGPWEQGHKLKTETKGWTTEREETGREINSRTTLAPESDKRYQRPVSSRTPPNPTTSGHRKHCLHRATSTHSNLLVSHRGPHWSSFSKSCNSLDATRSSQNWLLSSSGRTRSETCCSTWLSCGEITRQTHVDHDLWYASHCAALPNSRHREFLFIGPIHHHWRQTPTGSLQRKERVPQLGYEGNPATVLSRSTESFLCSTRSIFALGREPKGAQPRTSTFLRLPIIQGSRQHHRRGRDAQWVRPEGPAPVEPLLSRVISVLRSSNNWRCDASSASCLSNRIWWSPVIWSILRSSPPNLVFSLASNLVSILFTVSMVLFNCSIKEDNNPGSDFASRKPLFELARMSTPAEEEPDKGARAIQIEKKSFLEIFWSPLDFSSLSPFFEGEGEIFSIFNCLFLILVFFLLFLSCFSGVFIFLIFPVNISHKKLFCDFFLFELFGKAKYIEQKKNGSCGQKQSFEFSSNEESSFFWKKNYFHIDKRWGSRARLQALLTNGASRDEVEGVRSMCIPLSLIWAAGHLLHQAIFLLFLLYIIFSKLYVEKKSSVNVFLCPLVIFANFSNICVTSFFSSFHSLVFILIFLSFFFSLLLYCQGDQKAEDKTRHQDKWVKAVVGMVNKVWKGVFCWSVFQHDRRSELMGLDQPGRMPWLIILG